MAVDRLSFELHQIIAAEPAKVFAHLIDPARHIKWSGTAAEIEPWPGGGYRIDIAPGKRIEGDVVTIDPPNRLALRWGWAASAAIPADLAEVPARSTTVAIDIRTEATTSTVTLQQAGFRSRRSLAAHRRAWTYYLSRLAIAAANGDPGPDRLAERWDRGNAAHPRPDITRQS